MLKAAPVNIKRQFGMDVVFCVIVNCFYLC
ncbi:hypothetical protein MOTHE_c20180 [Moorella thermoacetica]|uniref:Uncharacterized protein n=1 Tax=Neomoorella thermoacetica TaxID=1525 RepID=A0A1J5JQM4_NEOTH|nr:hypothetical protein MOTHE_c20180 [Moorella thermoacetica]AKX97432.1 hypothetical protein MOTHA_c20960 [Moorella thermoacetica]APC09216.1 hypothetical protein MTJW_20670 [Moorella thermoacetica]OIQ09003.1 hypothetical protein MOOR_14000 [Moorella thermoacetica]OIQ10535.1 hypothetical protein MOOTH_25570 [Moorella thermoacetica]